MRPDRDPPQFATEAELCASFIEAVNAQGWATYPETSGWDVLCVRGDGTQVGVQAKLKPNLKVLAQAAKRLASPFAKTGPHYIAVLVPKPSRRDTYHDFVDVALALGLVVINPPRSSEYDDRPINSRWSNLGSVLFHLEPLHFDAPCWVPPVAVDVPAGVPCPIQLTAWKVQALRLLARLELRGYVVRSDFREIGLAPSSWQRRWLEMLPEGPPRWIRRPDVRLANDQHPEAFATILAQERAALARLAPPPESLPLFT